MMSDEDREFYTREYERIGAELIENESMGEGRVALYLGVWSAAVAGVGAMVTAATPAPPTLDPIVLAGLTVVLTLGIVTTARITKRNHHTDKLIDALSRLRHLLRPQTLILAALPWDDESDKDPFTRRRRPVLLHAGLLHVLCLANAVIPGLAIVALRRKEIALEGVSEGTLSFLVIATGIFLVVQIAFISFLNHRDWQRRRARGTVYEKTTA